MAALATAAAGGILMWRHWSDGTAFDRDTSIRFGIVVGIEFALAGIGAAILAARRRPTSSRSGSRSSSAYTSSRSRCCSDIR